MAPTTDTAAQFPPRWWSYWLVGLSVIGVLGLGLGINGIYTDRSQNAAAAAANTARDQQTAVLLGCLGDYTDSSATTSKAVREASVEVDSAGVDRDKALQRLFEHIATQPADNDPKGARLFGDLLAANGQLVTARNALAQVRKDNPVSDPPSEFCEEL